MGKKFQRAKGRPHASKFHVFLTMRGADKLFSPLAVAQRRGRPCSMRAAQIPFEFLEAGFASFLLPKITRGFEQLEDVLAARQFGSSHASNFHF